MNQCTSTATNPKIIGGDNPVTVNIKGLKVLDFNAAAKQRIITNIGLSVIFICYAITGTSKNYVFALPACGVAEDGTGGVYIDEMWQGPIFLFSSADGGQVVIEELI